MDLLGKSALVVGLARSGAAAAKELSRLGARVIVNDIKSEECFQELIKELNESADISFRLGEKPDGLVDKADLVVISPSVPIDSPFISSARSMGKEVISEVELAFRLCPAPVAAITGTNGKTTTTALTGEILRISGKRTHVVGNIGIPFISCVSQMQPDDMVVAEISSFQLEATNSFRPMVSAVLNITEDHLNRHKTMDNYINMKARIFENASGDDKVILNADNPLTVALASRARADVLFFSRKKILGRGAWVENGQVMVSMDGNVRSVCPVDSILIPGPPNLENALAACLIAASLGVDPSVMARALTSFTGVEHRIEKVAVIDGVTYFNDSKGTNPDASIKAIEAMKGPTVLIAGGMDKKSDFYGFVEAFGDTVTHLVVLGETAEKIARTAKEKGFTEIHRTNTLQEAVETASRLASPGGNVLLSPACASWDMFKDYEERGKIFKETVKGLRR
jgi:UDP-N-acetylmuramoylalanine--D-glutamate ligase